MRTPTKHLARSSVAMLGAVLVIAWAGLATARTMTGAPWKQPLLLASCAPAPDEGTVTDGATVADTSTTDCTTSETTDPAQQAAEAQAFFEGISDHCGTSVLGDVTLADAGVDPGTVQAFGGLADALNSGQVDHMVQSVRVLLENCQAHANDGLRNALYHHGLNWLRHHQHELWLEQKFAERWPDGKPGGNPHGNPHDADTETESTHGKPDAADKVHGNAHDADPSWAPGGGSSGGHGNAHGQTNK
jgi:hypothetical protein